MFAVGMTERSVTALAGVVSPMKRSVTPRRGRASDLLDRNSRPLAERARERQPEILGSAWPRERFIEQKKLRNEWRPDELTRKIAIFFGPLSNG